MFKYLRFSRSESSDNDDYKLLAFTSLSAVTLIAGVWLASVGGLSFITNQPFNPVLISLIGYACFHLSAPDYSSKNVILLLNTIVLVCMAILLLDELFINSLVQGLAFSSGTYVLAVIIISTPLGDLKVSRSVKMKLSLALAIIAVVAGTNIKVFNLDDISSPSVIILISSLTLLTYIQSLRTINEPAGRFSPLRIGMKIYGVLSLFLTVSVIYALAFL